MVFGAPTAGRQAATRGSTPTVSPSAAAVVRHDDPPTFFPTSNGSIVRAEPATRPVIKSPSTKSGGEDTPTTDGVSCYPQATGATISGAISRPSVSGRREVCTRPISGQACPSGRTPASTAPRGRVTTPTSSGGGQRRQRVAVSIARGAVSTPFLTRATVGRCTGSTGVTVPASTTPHGRATEPGSTGKRRVSPVDPTPTGATAARTRRGPGTTCREISRRHPAEVTSSACPRTAGKALTVEEDPRSAGVARPRT